MSFFHTPPLPALTMSSKLRRRGVKRHPKPDAAAYDQLANEDCPPVHWAPPLKVAWYALLTVRLIMSTVLPIGDCDEIFNNWEPTHYLMYGTGFQTWEYSPEFALRPYLYPAIHSVVGYAGEAIGAADKIAVFMAIKYAIALLSSVCEARFYDSIRRRFGPTIGVLVLIMLMFSPGMALASNSFLPSTFAMCMLMLSWGAWFLDQHFAAVMWGLVGTVVSGWPFCAVAAVPMALSVIWRAGIIKSILYGLVGLVTALVPQVAMDYLYYGKPVCALCNLVWYNVRGYLTAFDITDVAAAGPKLYGEEPWYYYFLNLSLNFGPILPLALAAPFSLVGLTGLINIRSSLVAWWPKPKLKSKEEVEVEVEAEAVAAIEADAARVVREQRRWTDRLLGDLLYISPLFLWLAFMIPQAHKEERFIFVVYPALCLAAATVIGRTCEIWELPAPRGSMPLSQKEKKRRAEMKQSILSVLRISFIVCLVLFTALRVTVLVQSAGASADSYRWLARVELPQAVERLETAAAATEPEDVNINVCVGREWHRFPSSFFLPTPPPPSNVSIRLRFIRSAFDGQLPQPFLNDSTAIQPGFNGENKMEENRYVPVGSCDYLVGMELKSQKEPRYNKQTDEWDVVYSSRFLDYAASRPVWRSFCLPWFGMEECVYGEWYVLRSKSKLRS